MVQIVNSESTSNETLRESYCLLSQNTSSLYLSNANSNNTLSWNEIESNPPLKVTTTQRGVILSAFFYAYGLSAFLGGPVTEKFGTKLIFIVAVLFDAVGNFLIPIASKTSFIFIIVIRCFMGFFQGMCYPSLHALLTKWIPKQEFSRFIGAVYLANSFGTIFTLQICGIIISKHGYELSFYVCGVLSLIWLVIWVLFMKEIPESHPRIGEKEKLYILENRTSSSNKKKRIPWLKMVTSLRAWAACIAHAGSMFGSSFLLTQLPLYMHSIIGLNIKTNGFLSSLPFLSRYLGGNCFSWLSNFLMKRTSWTTKTWQRIWTFLGHWCCGLSILLVGYVGCSSTGALILFSLAMFLNGASCPGYMCNYFQIAPNHAGTLLGMSNSVAFIYVTFGPIIVGALTTEETLGEWRIVYWIVFGSFFATGSFYMLFLSTDTQPWNDEPEIASERATENANEKEKLNCVVKPK
ncbi:UNVERIFIED_CONTAM: hypothetical protein RMT77_006127 [Armadillidium vulgare]